MDIHKLIRSRKSVKKFTNKKPDWRTILECVDAMRHAPKAGNNCTLKVVIVSDTNKIEKLSEAAQQPFFAQVHYMVVVCSDPTRLVKLYEKRGEFYNVQQSGAAIQNFLLKIEDVGLATCWVGHFLERKIQNILSIPKNIQVEAMFPIGYESKIKGKNTKPKNRIELEKIIYFDKYGKKRMKDMSKLNI
jgi:nitroreductase